jgi:hypothetical protein
VWYGGFDETQKAYFGRFALFDRLLEFWVGVFGEP